MKKIINIIIDSSGSMMEDDKNTIVKYLINGICSAHRNLIIENMSINLFQWGKETKQLDNLENAKIDFGGRNNIYGLEIIGKLINKEDTVLFVSDGSFGVLEKEHIMKLSNNILSIYVGIDANKKILKDISTNKEVYAVMDFIQALFDA
ncbi:VWA domain-containing protein [Peptacetobacter sp.]|uniref:VWA domain-containing protein n=1 Tax=Peptacetobacter sp. TaxID=2991975 RepID=UPI0026329143|nr:VWA domain-containing protein [Peptacetobacter sp.]